MYVLVEPGDADGFIHRAFEADDAACAIANAIEKWGEMEFDLVRSGAPDKKSVNVYAHRPAQPPPLN